MEAGQVVAGQIARCSSMALSTRKGRSLLLAAGEVQEGEAYPSIRGQGGAWRAQLRTRFSACGEVAFS